LKRIAVVGALAIFALAACFDWTALSPSADAGFALQLQGGCAVLGAPTGGALSLSGNPFTVSFWMTVDTATPGLVVWHGGSAVGEPGWSFAVDANGQMIDFCIANNSDKVCVQAAFTLRDAIHVAITSAPGPSEHMRAMQLYTLDWTAGETKHTLATNNTADNSWGTSAVFSLGGAWSDAGCERTADVTLHDVRVWSSALAASELDANYNKNIDGGVTVEFRLDEGSGTTAADSTNNVLPLTLVAPFTWARSPFP
jgi:hypothetical protein